MGGRLAPVSAAKRARAVGCGDGAGLGTDIGAGVGKGDGTGEGNGDGRTAPEVAPKMVRPRYGALGCDPSGPETAHKTGLPAHGSVEGCTRQDSRLTRRSMAAQDRTPGSLAGRWLHKTGLPAHSPVEGCTRQDSRLTGRSRAAQAAD